MDRRTYLGAIGATGTLALAGCVTGLFEDQPEDVILSPQDDQIAESSNLAYPAYGESLPSFELTDPLSDTVIDTGQLDKTAILTAFFAFCPAECGVLLHRLADVQSMTNENGLTDEVVFLPITFDPERDDDDTLRDNAEMNRVDLDAGNWHYLRPADDEEAREIVGDTLGLEYERVAESERVEYYDFNHIVVTILANPDGVVERAYRGENLDRERVFADIETIVDNA